MDIPVSGYMYSSDDPSPMHSHRLYITSWDGRAVHTHEFSGMTSFDDGHNHQYAGTTQPAPTGVQHTHQYFTFTTVDNRHRHQIRGVTGPAIPLPNGGHYHEFKGVTTIDGMHPHRHSYGGRTGL